MLLILKHTFYVQQPHTSDQGEHQLQQTNTLTAINHLHFA